MARQFSIGSDKLRGVLTTMELLHDSGKLQDRDAVLAWLASFQPEWPEELRRKLADRFARSKRFN